MTNTSNPKKCAEILVRLLIALIFVSKISLRFWFPFLANNSFIVFQQGMHPYLNMFFCTVLGGALFVQLPKLSAKNELSIYYRIFLGGTILILLVQTFLQMVFLSSPETMLMRLGTLSSAILLLLIYGLLIPMTTKQGDLVIQMQRWAGSLVVVSISLWLLNPAICYKGGRFIGVFKHIPHMVTCSSIAFVFSAGLWIEKRASISQRIWSAFILISSAFALFLTGTRSSLAALCFVSMVVLFTIRNNSFVHKMLRLSLIFFLCSSILLFSVPAFDFVKSVANGEISIGKREAQNGFATRWHEVERGLIIFNSQPWIGQGLASKFETAGEIDVANYNSFKDPHNIFVSAGVIGGWPLIFWTVVALLMITIGSMRGYFVHRTSKKVFALFVISHIPILIIYHLHLSIGGMADRAYWLAFGILAVRESKKH